MERRGVPTQVRQRIEDEIGERLRKAKEAGDLAREVEQADAQIISLSTDIERAKEVRDERRQAARERLDNMTAAELGAYIEERTPPDVRDLVDRDQETQQARHQAEALDREYSKEADAERRARSEAQEWRETHPLRAKMHDAGLMRSEQLAELESTAKRHGQRAQELRQQADQAGKRGTQIRLQRWNEIERGQAPARERLAKLEKIRQDKAAREAQERTAKAEREKQARPDQASVEERLRAAKEIGEREREEPHRQRPPPERMR
ncbi:hypothetical protein D3C86_803320 [compost metagenome]